MQQPGKQDGTQRMGWTGSEENRGADFASAEDGDSGSAGTGTGPRPGTSWCDCKRIWRTTAKGWTGR